jgi:transcriptional regulator with XRE-family HTH domain
MIGERLKQLRKANSIKQEELAQIIGVQKSTVSLYELGKSDPSDKVKIEIAKHFHISLDYLLGVIDEPVPYYSPDIFLKLPSGMLKKEKNMLADYLDYLSDRIQKNV